ncbi:MAG: DUF3108 domain-containing protein [Candidatus Accumulibacter sp.]|jgi:hypothetical protein|nr:DUF3108 domain-containing protein [Accumulibacter sp.]
MDRPSAAIPAAFLVALAASLGLHAAALFLPRIDPASEAGARPLLAELRPAPLEDSVKPLPAPPPALREEVKEPEKSPRAPATTPKRPPPRKKVTPPRAVAALAVPGDGPSIPAASPEPAGVDGSSTDAPPSATEKPEPAAPAAVPARLPPRGRIRFRVDWGDSGFEIGFARQEWTFEAERYRLVSSAETTGLAWLIRSVNIDMESVGRISAGGLRPEAFGVMRSGKKARERALFDWEAMKIRVSDASDNALDEGAQDLLSFYYQLGFLEVAPGQTVSMPLATGKKYGVYRLENLGDEIVDVPLGNLLARHLRTPGENATEIWLAYEYRLLPVKIRHVDNKGETFVQAATEILFGE